MKKYIFENNKFYKVIEEKQEISNEDIITALELMNVWGTKTNNTLKLKPHNEWKPTDPRIIINPEKWGYNEDWTLDPQACEYKGNWYYNFPAVQLLKWVPTKEQWEKICKPYWDDAERLSKELWLTMAGYRHRSTGLYYTQGIYEYYWSSSPSTTNGFYLYFYSTNVHPTNANNCAFGFSCRLLED